MHNRKSGLRLAVLVAIVAALLALTATAALAGPSDPTLSVDELQAKIDANGGAMDGYLKTVIKGKDIVEIDVTVLAVTTGFGSGPADMSSLILFESNDPIITKIGGIAAGMSGSPIYVDDNGTDKLIGALSYGDMFTTGGTGLATPIDAMVNIQNDWVASGMPRKLSSPVIIDGQVKDRVLIPTDPEAVTTEPANTIVAKPLNAVFLGGLNPNSRMYKAYAKVLKSRGVEVIATQGGLSSKVSTYSAPFEGGSAVAVLAARGDLWAGGVGTVTYTDSTSGTDTVLAFGHPAFWEGDSGLYLCNAWVDGVWPSTLEAYKLARPAAVRGTLAQDRSAGILGVDGEYTPETPITATATRGSKVATSLVQVPRYVADSSTGNYYGLAAASAYVAGSRLFDASMNPGSAVTTTTVTLLDESDGHTYTLVRRNAYSEGYDVSMAVVSDVDEMVSSFQEANGNGIAKAQVLSVDLETTFSSVRKEAEIVDLKVAGGLKANADNTVTVSFLEYGNPDTQTVPAVLHIPANTPVTGQLSANAVNNPGEGGDFSEDLFAEDGSDDYGSGVDRRSVKDVVSELSEAVDNTVMSVTFQPVDMSAGDDGEEEPAPTEDYDAIETTLATEWVISGTAAKVAPKFDAYTYDDDYTLAYGTPTLVIGELTGVEDKGLVTVNSNGSNVATVSVVGGSFTYPTPVLYRNTTLTFTFLGNDSALPVTTKLVVKVYAKTTLSASSTTPTHGKVVTLTAKVYPKGSTGSVTFQRWNGYEWVTAKGNVTLTTNSSYTYATYKYTPSKAGTVKLRARFNGNTNNLASNSPSITLKVK